MRHVLLWMTIVATALTTSLAAQDSPSRTTVTLSDPGQPATLDVRMSGGDIEIRTHAGSDVVITADDDVFGSTEETQGLRRLTTGRLSVDEEDNVITVRGSRFDSPDLLIEVPVRTNLRVESFNDGVTVDGVEGDLEVTSQNDNVRLTNVSGSMVVHSQNDDVEVTIARVNPEALMAFSSVNGDVDVTLPDSIRANLSMRTVNGDIYTDFELEVTTAADADDNSRAFRRGRREQSVRGTVNGGGPEYEFQTVNGSIFIRRAR